MRMIDADALCIGRCDPDIFQNAAYVAGWNGVVNIIQSTPTIDAVPVVHARIIGTGYNLHCSNCKESADIGNDYCPHCGARMDAQKHTK